MWPHLLSRPAARQAGDTAIGLVCVSVCVIRSDVLVVEDACSVVVVAEYRWRLQSSGKKDWWTAAVN